MPRQGIKTADKGRFLRTWFEVNNKKLSFNRNSNINKWFPCNKGGSFRKWYGNNEYVVNWENDGFEIKNISDDKGKLKSRPQNLQYFFRDSLTWSKVTIGGFSMRYVPKGSVFCRGKSCIRKQLPEPDPEFLGRSRKDLPAVRL